MPAPVTQHADAALTKLSIDYVNQTFIADQVVPRVPVSKISDKYFLFGREKQAYIPKAKRAHGTNYREVEYALSTDSYACEDYGLTHLVERDEYNNADPGLDPEQDATILLTEQIKLAREYRVATLLTTSGNYAAANTAALSGTNRWDDAGSDPVAMIDQYKQVVVDACGRSINTLVIGAPIWRYLRNHAAVKDRVKYVGGNVDASALAQLFDVQKVIKADPVYNTADEGQTASLSSLWAKNVVGLYVPQGSVISRRTPLFAAQFVYRDFQVRVFEHERKLGNWVEVSEFQDEKVCGNAFGFLLRTVIS